MPFRPIPLAVLLLCLPAGAGWAAAGKTGFSFLETAPDAASAGAGGAVAALMGDPAALFCNPAGLARISAPEAALHSRSALKDVTEEAVSFVRPAGRGMGWGAAAGFQNVGGLVKTRADPSSIDGFSTDGSVGAGDQFAGAALGGPWTEDGAWGVGLKAAREALDRRASGLLAMDAGFVGWLDAEWRLAGAVRNLGLSTRLSSERTPPPALLQVGAAFQSAPWADWEADWSKPLRGDDEILLGGRFSWQRAAFLRLGYEVRLRKDGLGSMSGMAAGLGGRWGAFGADYAVQPFGDLGWAHRISVSWRLGGRKNSQSRTP